MGLLSIIVLDLLLFGIFVMALGGLVFLIVGLILRKKNKTAAIIFFVLAALAEIPLIIFLFVMTL